MINYLYTHPMLYYYFVHPAICNEVFPLLQRWSRLSLNDVYSQSNISICWFCLILAIHMLPTKYALHYLRCQLKCPVKRVQTTTGYNSTYHLGPLLTIWFFLMLLLSSSCAFRLSWETYSLLQKSHPNPPLFRFMTQ